MRICHITSVHNYNDTRITLKECVSLKEAGNEVHLVTINEKDLKYKGIYIHGLKRKRQSRIKRIISSSKQFYKKALEIDADIYHFHDPELIPLGKKLIKKGKKVIYDVHEDVPRQIMSKYWIPNNLRTITSKVFEVYENNSVKKFSGIITATPHIKNRFLDKNKHVVDIKNYPILNELFISKKYINPAKENSMIYIGGISEKRGLFTMVNALNKLSNVQLKLAGTFSNDKEYQKVKKSQKWDKIDFLGFIGREEIRENLNKSKVGLVVLHPLASYKDSLPIKMFEYMAAGLPVVASSFPLWEEIIIKNNCGICVNPKSSQEIAEAVRWIIENPIKSNEMGKRGRMAIEKEYNWEIESL